MSNKLIGNGNDGRIVNPFAQNVLTLKVDDQFNTELKAPNMHPAHVTKILMNVMFDVMYSYIDTVTKANEKQPQSENNIIQ